MHKIDTADATENNEFTTGVPGVSESTEVDEDWFNAYQNELCNVITETGAELDKESHTQLVTAIKDLAHNSTLTIELENNISEFADLTGVIFDSSKIKSADLIIDIYRSDNNYELVGCAHLYAAHLPNGGIWKLFVDMKGDDELFDEAIAKVSFDIDEATGQVKYKTANMEGGNHSSEVKVKILKFKVTQEE